VLSSTLADITDGEVLQLRALADLDTTLAAYVEIAAKKTGSLFAASASAARWRRAERRSRSRRCATSGLAFGVAFQMRDDLLDLTADEASLGKPVGNDLRERKMTVPLDPGARAGDREFRSDVERFMNEHDDSQDRIAGIVAGIGAQGGLAKTEAALAGYVERAKASLAPLGNAPARAELAALADALIFEEKVTYVLTHGSRRRRRRSRSWSSAPTSSPNSPAAPARPRKSSWSVRPRPTSPPNGRVKKRARAEAEARAATAAERRRSTASARAVRTGPHHRRTGPHHDRSPAVSKGA
jgi:hypothetical protein